MTEKKNPESGVGMEEWRLGGLTGNQYDLFFFPIVDFSYLYQRPQQLASHFAKKGHRVFYLNLSRFVPAESGKSFRISRIRENLYEVFLKGPGPLRVYEDYLEGGTLDMLYSSLEALRREWGMTTCVSLVHNPFWTPLALRMRDEHDWKLFYDCMDNWDTFKNIGEPFLVKEKELVEKADFVTVTADLLLSRWKNAAKRCVLVRNACDYKHFNKVTESDSLEGIKKPIVGFFGGIAEWVDVDLVAYAATQRKDCSFVLLGGVYTDVTGIEKLPNVFLLGSKPYEEMPAYLFRFDVCIIPFKKNKVTEAADPVKLYEYLSLGKPVVARDLHSMIPYRDYIYLFDSSEEFVKRIGDALTESDSEIRDKRRALAASNTWEERIGVMEEEIRLQYKKVSVILVTHNQGSLLEMCIENLLAKTDYPNLEILLIENRPTEKIRAYLDQLPRRHDWIKPVRVDKRKLARAYGLAVERSDGEVIVLLNGKTVVTKGWLTRLVRDLERDPRIGMIGPALSCCVDDYGKDLPFMMNHEIDRIAYDCPPSAEGKVIDVTALPDGCVAVRREVVVQAGSAGKGSARRYKAPNLSKRAKVGGYRVVCAEDVFVQDFSQAHSVRRKGMDMLRQVRNGMRRLLETGRGGINRVWQARFSQPSPTVDKEILKTKEYWAEESDAWRVGRGRFWLEHELVQRRINEKVTGDPNKDSTRYLVEFMSQRGYSLPLERCLTLGCGAGVVERAFAQHHFCLRHDAIDISDGAIEKAIKAARADNLTHVHYEVQDINRIQLPPETYDVVFGVSSLHHFRELEHIFDEVNKALKPGGLFFINEYVGPSQFQWTERQMEVVNSILKILPKRYRRSVIAPGQFKEMETRPTIGEVTNVDASEAIRSGEILPLLNKYFKILDIKHLGGALLHILLTNIAGNFGIDDEEDVKLLKTIFYFEDLLMEHGELPSDFAVIIAEKSRWR